MPIPSTGQISLNDDVNSTLQADTNEVDVSLGDNNTVKFTTPALGNTITGRSMSELRGASLFSINEHSLGESLHLDNPTSSDNHIVIDPADYRNTAGTFSFWVKEHNKAHSSDNTYISTGSSQTARIWVRKHTSGSSLDSKIKIAVDSVNFISDAVVLDNTGWYHHVVSIDTNQPTDANKIRYWINGIELTWETIGNLSDGQNLYFGYSQEINEVFYTSGYGFDATYADFKYIDGKALLPKEFGELKYGIWVPKEVNKQSSESLVTTGLVSSYDFTNGSLLDGTGSNNATSSNVTFLNNNYGVSSFNGSSSRIDLPNNPISTNLTGSVSLWVSGSSLTNTTTAVYMILYNRNPYISLDVYNGNLNCTVKNSSSSNTTISYATSNFNATDWYHISYVVNGTSSIFELYVNGLRVGTATAPSTTLNVASSGYLGHGGGYQYLNGKIGEVQIYSSGLTSAQILQNYNATKHKYFYGLNGWHLPLSNVSTGSIDSSSNLKLHLDASDSSSYSGSGTNWNDLTSNNNDGTISGANYLSSTNGGVFDFDGSNDFVSIASSGLLTGDFTIEMWWKFDTLNNYRMLWGGSDYAGTNTTGGLGHYIQNQTVRTWLINSSGSAVNVATSGNVLSTNKWHHIVLTRSGSNVKSYVDGKETSSGTYSGDLSSANTYIGAHYNDPDYHVDGKNAQTRVYNKALTAQEIITNYRATQGNYEQVSTVDISGNGIASSEGGSNLTYQAHTNSKPNENYATLRTQSLLSGPGLTKGNLRCTNSNSYFAQFESTLAATSGKWYAEVTVADEGNNTIQIGAASHRTIHWNGSPTNNLNGINTGYTLWNMDNDSAGNYAVIYVDGSRSQTSTNYKAVDGDVCGILLNLDDSEVTFYKNNAIVDQVRGITRASDELTYFVATTRTNSGQGVLDWNFGQKAFTYPLPSGYKALATHNLPAITISPDDKEKPRDHFDIVTWNGNGLKQDIKGLDFKPDLLITKNFTNSSNYHWIWVDNVRGIDKVLYSSHATNVQVNTTDSFKTFNSDGFSIGTNLDSQNAANITKSGYIAYAFKGAGDAVPNTDGTITTQVSANTTAGFSIATYTGVGYPNSSTAEIGHGLNKAPELVIIKATGGTGQSGGAGGWVVGSSLLGSGWEGSLYLHSANAYYSGINYFWNAAATSDVVKLKNDWYVNGVNNNYVMYSWHSVEGYSKIGTYEGNGNANGPFVYTGFKPKFVMIKNVDDAGSWIIHDTVREASNDMVNHIRFNTTGIEDDGVNERIQMFSNGFKLIASGQNVNHSETYIFMAFADDAVQYSQGTAKESGVEKFIDQTDQGTSGYPDEYFKSVTYTGNGASQFIETGLKPGLSWLKKRTNDTKHHRFFDTVRGAGNAIYSPSTSGNTSDEGISAFHDNGFTLGSASGTNENTDTFVSWNWRAGDTTVTKKPTYTSAGILTSNLALHYNFADSNTYSGTGTTVYDLTSNDKDGTLTNGPAWKTNAYGNYFDFDGSNDYIQTNLALTSTNVTAEFWFNSDVSTSTNQPLFFTSNGGRIDVNIAEGTPGANGYYNILNILVPARYEWNHLAVVTEGFAGSYSGTYGSAITFTVYLNGNKIASSGSLTPYAQTANGYEANMRIGRSGGGYYFNGKIGQTRMYTAVLTQAQIRANYDATRTLYQGVGTTANVLQTNLQLNYDIDDFDTYDSNWGKDNKVAVLNGSSSIIQSSISKTVLANNFSVSFWWKPNLMNTFQVPMGGLYDETGNIAYGWMVYQGSDNKMHLYWIISSSPNTSNSISNNVVLEQGKWYHVVATKTSSGASIHVNALSASSSLAQGNQFGIVYNTNPTFYIGKRNISNNYANGSMDQVRIFNKAVNDAEVKKLYSETQSQNSTLQILGDTSCIATYNFNGNYNDLSTNYNGSQSNVTLADDAIITANRITDKTSNNRSGTLIGGTVKKSNIGKYVYLDGSNDYIEGPAASSIISSGTTDITIEGWVYMKSHPSAYDGIIGTMNATSPFGGWMIYNHHITDNYGFGLNVGGTWTSIDTRASIDLNVWTHVAATYDGSIMKFYKNGKLTLIHQVSGTIAYTTGDLNFRIGLNASAYSDMNFAQARVYSAALSFDQVKANYDATKEQFYGALVHADVSVNDKSGFSIAKWTGTGVNGITVPHGMEKAPEVIFTKGLTNVTSWVSGVGGMTEYELFDYMQISTQGDISNSSTFYQGYKSTGFTAGVSSANEFNKNDSNEYISYCWRSIPGYSKIGVYNGTGGVNDIYTGFQPRWVMIKRSDSDNYWAIFDAARDNAGDMSQILWGNAVDVEADGGNTSSILTSATGFGMDSSAVGGSMNANNGTYMYMAFA